MERTELLERYGQWQKCAGWSCADVQRVVLAGTMLAPHFTRLADDFLAASEDDSAVQRALMGDGTQWANLQRALADWLTSLFAGRYDDAYVASRWQIGQRHAELELHPVHTYLVMSRMRLRMVDLLHTHWAGAPDALPDTIRSLATLLDLDLAIVANAYESEHSRHRKVAQRTRMRNVLHQGKEFAEGLWEHAQAIILVLDVHGCILRYNPYLEALTGVPHREVKGVNWFERFVPEPEQERQRKTLEETLLADTSTAVSTLLTQSGRERRISWSNTSLKNVAGQTVAVLSVGQDVTELNVAQQRALQAERLAGIGQMITGLAHESRNALQRIQACAEMLELEVDGNPAALDLVHRIKLAQDHMHRLFDEVRGYAAPVKLDRSPCHLGAIWREAWELLLPQWEGRIAEMIERTDDAELSFQGDHFRLVQLFRILLENALAACADPVRIEITCRPTTLGTSKAIEISVRDNGPGLNQEQRAHMFEPFYTTKTKGTGLGLAIAQRIVEAHGGHIMPGDPARGAEIVVLFPGMGAPESGHATS